MGGTYCTIIGDVNIGKNSAIGANSVVTKDIPDYSVAVGMPAKVIKKYNFSISRWEKYSLEAFYDSERVMGK